MKRTLTLLLAVLAGTVSTNADTYRLSLDQALGAAPLILLVDGTKAVAMPLHHASLPWPADASQLTIRDGIVTGIVTVSVMSPASLHSERIQRGNPIAKYELKPSLTATFNLNINGATGTYHAAWSGKSLPFYATPGQQGSVSALREPARALPATCDVDLYLYAALADVVPFPAVWLRATLKDGAATGFKAHISPSPPSSSKALTLSDASLTVRDGKLTGRLAGSVPGMDDKPFTLELTGDVIGRQLFGTVTFVQGELRVTTAWVGAVHEAAAWRYPLEFPRGNWAWEHSLPADPALVGQALAEAQQPVMPGEPGKAGFWTWRSLVMGQPASVIHPPTFDVQETAGAARYRYTVTGAKDATAGVRAEFTDEKPWQSLAPVWKDLKPGLYRLTVTPLDATGKELSATMRIGMLDRTNAAPATIEVARIDCVKRPSFAGPYFPAPRAWNEIALATSRWHREAPGAVEARGQGPMHGFATGGEGPFAWFGATQLWPTLAVRSLSTDPAEKAWAEQMLAFIAEEMEIHQRVVEPRGFFYAYKGYTPLSRWNAEAALDAFLQTGDERWRNILLAYGRALVGLQNDGGGFASCGAKGKGGPPGGFFANWRTGNPEFGASEMLYVLGRLRRDLKTTEFVAAENKALAWMKDKAVRERYWPIYVHHSMSQGYPVWQHSMSALFFVRYLLECAPPAARDVKLAEQVARWAEDYGVDWTRLTGPQTGQITPVIRSGDRMGSDPVAVNLLAALAFQQLAKATGDKLWAAKADALAAAVAQAQDPATGYLQVGLVPKLSDAHDRQFADALHTGAVSCRTWTVQLLREYAAMSK